MLISLLFALLAFAAPTQASLRAEADTQVANAKVRFRTCETQPDLGVLAMGDHHFGVAGVNITSATWSGSLQARNSRGIPQQARSYTTEKNPADAFTNWAELNGKEYGTPEERERRFSIWLDNLDYIENYNSKHSTNWLSLGPFMDLTGGEFQSSVLGLDEETDQADP